MNKQQQAGSPQDSVFLRLHNKMTDQEKEKLRTLTGEIAKLEIQLQRKALDKQEFILYLQENYGIY